MKSRRLEIPVTSEEMPEGLRRKPRPDDANAFVTDTTGERRPLPEAEAEALAEEFIGAATGGESLAQEAEDELAPDEDGGPYLVLEEEELLEEELEVVENLDLERDVRLSRACLDKVPKRVR